MSSRPVGRRLLGAAALLVNLASACGPSTPSATTLPSSLGASATVQSLPPANDPDPSLQVTSPTAPPAPASATVSAPVQVLALGNINIRRGPNLAFNSIAILSKGAVATANGRDVLSNWLRIPLPNDATQNGWVSIMSEFTRVTGSLDTLPELDPQEWPNLAWLRNCTLHELWVAPVGLALPPVYEFPNNELRLNPGTYSVMDTDVDGYPEILKADLSEGKTIEVLVDGLGEKKKCPVQ